MLVKQRDNEIAILVNYLNKKKEAGGDVPGIPVHRNNDTTNETMNMSSNSQQNQSFTAEERKEPGTLY